MKPSHRRWSAACAAMTSLVVLGLAALAQAQTFTTLYNFTGGSDGGNPVAGVIQGNVGDLYGTAAGGGDFNCDPQNGCGVVYKLDAAGRETVLHTFSGSDGAYPVTPVTRDEAGNMYGTTDGGGSSSGCGSYGCGTVFKIDSAGNETVLYSFTGGLDGCFPDQGVIRDKAGNLYGTTAAFSCSGSGTIFKVDSAGKFTLLHSFAGAPSDGARPQLGHLAMDKYGNLYGVTSYGGANDYGVLFKLSKNGVLLVLHSFAGDASDGCGPLGSVVRDEAGSLYGTTSSFNCSTNYGTIWKVGKNGKETILHNFAGGTSDGCSPVAGVAPDSTGNLYGVTQFCGANNFGALYELNAERELTLLHSFDGSDGWGPAGEVLLTSKGTLFGTAEYDETGNCGGLGCGTVWEYVP